MSKPIQWWCRNVLWTENPLSQWASCPSCGAANITKLSGRDPFDRVSLAPWSLWHKFTKGERYSCHRCRLQFFDRRPFDQAREAWATGSLITCTPPGTGWIQRLTNVLHPGFWENARCPRCSNRDLKVWDDEDRFPPLSIQIWLVLGAKPFSCPDCHQHFSSFRPRKTEASGKVNSISPLAEESPAETLPLAMGAAVGGTPKQAKTPKEKTRSEGWEDLL